MHYVSKIFPFADFGQNFQRVLGNNLVSHWCSHPFTAHGIMRLSSAFLSTHNALLE